MWWCKLDNTDGSIELESETRNSKWEFYGTYDEMLDWLPEPNDFADWTLLNSRDESLGYTWAGDNYRVNSIRYTALSRFQWTVNITARRINNVTDKNSGGGGGGGGKRGGQALGSLVEYEWGNSSFTLTEEMTGYVKRPNTLAYEDASSDPTSTWTEGVNCPFHPRPDRNLTNHTYSLSCVTITRYIKGDPIQNKSAFNEYSGVMTMKVYENDWTGWVIGQDTRLVYDDDGDAFTAVSVTLQHAPKDMEWNPGWEG